jgi:peroxiredoxin
MKHTLIALLSFLLPAAGFAQGESFTLNGKIGNLNSPAKIHLSYWSGGEHIDSTFVNNGNFSFQGIIDGPSASRLILDYSGNGLIPAAQANHILYLYLEPGTVELQSPDSLQHIAFVNSPINDAHRDYLKQIGGQVQDLAAGMNKKIESASPEQLQDTVFTNGLNREYRALLAERANKQKQYARAHPDSFFSIVAISESGTMDFDINELEPLFLSINEKHRNTADGKVFALRINAAKTIGIGKEAPDFTQNDPNDHPIKLSDFRGRYVLLDFWASWCGPCRQENPNLLKAYAQYKEKGFEILGVSLDNKDGKKAWMDAIQKDGLLWPQVSDLNSWSNAVALAYGVRAVPQNYLIDPQGIIVAQNLRGDELEKLLEKLFNI